MNVIDRYFFLLLVNSTNKNQKITVLKSINSSQYKVLKDITFKILNEIIPIDRLQFRKLSKHKNFIRKLGTNKKISGQLLGKNYSVVIDIIRIGLQHNEIPSEIHISSKRRMGKNKSSCKKSKAIGYSERKEQFTSESSEEFSSEELSSEESCNEKSKSEYSSSGEEFTEESTEKSSEEESIEEEEEESIEEEETQPKENE